MAESEHSADVSEKARDFLKSWCRRRGLNPRPPAYEADALPLSYAGCRGIAPLIKALAALGK